MNTFKRILLLSLLFSLFVFCLLAVMPTTYAMDTHIHNVTNYDELRNASFSSYWPVPANVVINLKNDIVINTNDYEYFFNNVSRGGGLTFNNVTVTINGNGHNLIVNMSKGVYYPEFLNFEYCDVEINNLNIVNSNFTQLSGGNTISGSGGTYIRPNSVIGFVGINNSLTIRDCKLLNSTVGNRDFSFIGMNSRNDSNIVIENVTISGNSVGRMVCFSYRSFYGDQYLEYPPAEINLKNISIENNNLSWVIDSPNSVRFVVSEISIANNSFLGSGAVRITNACDENEISNCSFVNNILYWELVQFFGGEGSLLLKNSYFENNTITSPRSFILIGNGNVVHNTFVDNNINMSSGSAYFYGQTTNPKLIAFNTFVNNSFNDSLFFQSSVTAFGNLFVNSTIMAEASAVDNIYSNNYFEVFGTNVPALNGGKTKNIQLSDKETNPVLDKISVADYQTKIGTNPNSDTDQTGKDRLYGSAVDYGSVEYQKGTIGTIIDDIIDIFKPSGNNSSLNKLNNSNLSDIGSNSGLFSKTKPSMEDFLFGNGSIIDRTSNLLYFITLNWVKLNVPIISPISQGIINLAGWE